MEQRTIDLVHSTFCEKQHNHNPEDLMNPQKQGKCYYYIESQVDQGDSMEDHLLWVKETQGIADLLSLNSDDEMIRFIEHVGQAVVKFYLVLNLYPNSKETLIRALRL